MFYSFADPSAVHDDAVRYRLPFDPSVPRKLGQGVNGDMGYDLYGNAVSSPQDNPTSHDGANEFAFDWWMPAGTTVVAARAGEVARVVDSIPGAQGDYTNVVLVKHADGTFATYQGMQAGISAKPGQKVQVGDPLGKSGNWSNGAAAIHFAVSRLDEDGKPVTIPIRFDDGSAEGVVPVPGLYYGGEGGKAAKASAPPGEAKPQSP
jgi:murein DD-endopeptidase MepM/ murein hydrolase activator NlpD